MMNGQMAIAEEKQKVFIPKVEVTTDYDQFKRIIGNRPVNISHVNELIKKSLKADISYAFPAVVTKDNYLVDGQHRLEKAKANKRPFYFIRLKENVDDVIVAVVNTLSLRWTPEDYLRFFAERGNEQHVFIEELIKQYGLSLANTIAVAGAGGSALSRLKRGELVLYKTEEEKAAIIDLFEAYAQLKDTLPHRVYIDRDFVRAFRVIIQHVSVPEIIDAVSRAHLAVTEQVNTKDYLRVFESIFNHRRHEKNQVRFF